MSRALFSHPAQELLAMIVLAAMSGPPHQDYENCDTARLYVARHLKQPYSPNGPTPEQYLRCYGVNMCGVYPNLCPP